MAKRLTVIVKPNARHEGVEALSDGSYRVAVNAPPMEGKANARVVALLAAFFHIPPSSVHIVHGGRGKKKLIEISS